MPRSIVFIAAAGLLLVAAGLPLVAAGCTQHEMTRIVPTGCCCAPWPSPSYSVDTRDVDLLFVVDNSGSMADEQERLKEQFPTLMSELRTMRGGLPNLHIGVTTTDLGTGMFQITYCEEVGGEAGALQTGSCQNPTGVPYIVDVEPRSCEIIRDAASNTCLSHTCDQTHCAREPSTTFVEDSTTGCPRCRNYADESLEDVFSCVAVLGTSGCGFEQPLEAMYKALDSANTANAGFVRDSAMLAVVLITDEDDCSASNPTLYDNTQTGVDSTLGPLSSFRCFEYGVTCDIDSRTHEGVRQNCVPREDAGALLHPISRYVDFLRALKDPQMLVLSAIAGPVTPSASGDGFNVMVALDDEGRPELQPSCANFEGEGGAVPAIRIHSLVSALGPAVEVQEWAYSSVCAGSYAATLTGIGRKIAEALTLDCLPQPLRGCADPGVEYGSPQAAQTCEVNSQCRANCSVTAVYARGLPDEAEFEVVPCLEVCPDGPCPGNVDRTRAYAGGHPAERDPALPVLSCWHIAFEQHCTASHGARLVVSRRFEPPPRSFTNVACQHIAPEEQLCHDGQDNDEDCLVDVDDPDCSR